MEALGLSPLSTVSVSRPDSHFQKLSSSNLLGRRPNCLRSAELSSLRRRTHFSQTHRLSRSLIRVRAAEEDYEVKQMRDMAAAKKRWEALLREGKVKVLTPKEAGYAIQLSNKTLLDVRPSTEHKKAWVKGSTWIPIFEVDNSFDAGSISRKVSSFLFGGWWSGVPTLSFDNKFLSKVEEKFPEDADLIVACQKGLRSLAACEILHNAGYENLFWVQGGLEAAEEEDLAREGSQPLKFAGIGGVSEFLGWTDQQRAAAAREGWGYRIVFSARLLGLVILVDALYIGAQQLAHYVQDIRSQ